MIYPYPEYKSVRFSWLKESPVEWETIKLKHIASISFSSVDRKESDDKIPLSVCHYPDAYKNEIIDLKTKLSEGYCLQREIDQYALKKGQIIITKDSETADDIGIPAYVECDIPNAVCGYHLAIIEANKNNVLPKFIFRYLQSDVISTYFENNSNGVTRFGLGKSTIENLFLPLPSYTEQRQIVDYLDHKTNTIDQLITKKANLIELLKEKRQAIINEAVTKGIDSDVKLKDSREKWIGDIPQHWEMVKLKHLVIRITESPVIESNLIKVALENLQSMTGKYISSSEEPFEGIGNIFYPGDILFNKLRPYLAKVYHAKEEGIAVGELLVLRPNQESITSSFLFYRLLSPAFIEIVDSSTYGAKMPRANWDFIGSLPIALPTIEEQNRIIDFIEEKIKLFEKIAQKLDLQINKLKEYRQSLISEAVTGKIDVRNWKPETQNN